MRKAYLFIYNDIVGTRESIKDVFDSMKGITTWRYDMPHNFYIVSEHSSVELYNEFVAKNGEKGRFMFVEVSDNRYGYMLPDSWYLFTNKTHKPKKT